MADCMVRLDDCRLEVTLFMTLTVNVMLVMLVMLMKWSCPRGVRRSGSVDDVELFQH